MSTLRGFRFGDFEVDLGTYQLRRNDRVVKLEPTPFRLLLLLLESAGETLSRSALNDALWPDAVVSESALLSAVKRVRSALDPDWICTVRGRGYRFVGEVESIVDGPRIVSSLREASAKRRTSTGRAAKTGRQQILERADRALEEALGGHGSAMLLVGEPGIGKSHTARAVAERADALGFCVVAGRCSEGEGAPAYWPWACVLRQLFGEVMERVASTDIARISYHIPELADWSDHATDDRRVASTNENASENRHLLLAAVVEVLRVAAGERPLLLVLEDLHWADLPSLRLLSQLLRDLESTSICVVATARDLDLSADVVRGPLVDGMLHSGCLWRELLRGLDRDVIRELATLEIGGELSDESLDRVTTRSGGNPLFARLLLRMREEDSLHLPTRISDAVLCHLDRLPPGSLELLRTGAVFGRGFGLGVLAHASELTPAQVLEKLEPALAARIVQPLENGLGFEFVHALIAEAMVARLSARDRAQEHARVGRAIEAVHISDPLQLSVLAYHFSRAAPAGEVERGVRYARAAAERALTAQAFEDAARHFKGALEVSELEAGEPRRRLELLLGLGDSLHGCADYGPAREAFDRSRELALELGDVDALAHAALGYSIEDETAVSQPDSVNRLEEANDALGDHAKRHRGQAASGEKSEGLAIRVQARLAEALYFSNRERALSLSRDAVQRARRAGVPSNLYFALKRHHWVLHDPTHLDERLRVSRELGDTAETLHDPVRSLAARMCVIQDLVERGLGDQLEREVQSFHLRASSLRQPYYVWYASLYRTMFLTMRGDFDAAEAEIERAHALGRETGAEIAEVWYAVQLFVLRRWQGRLAECEPVIRDVSVRHRQPTWTGSLAVIAAVDGDREFAISALDDFLRDDLANVPLDLTRLSTLAFLAEVCCELQDVEAARRLRPAFDPYMDQHVVLGLAIAHYGSVAGYAGRLAALAGEPAQALLDLARAVALDGEAGAGFPLATDEVALGELMLETGLTDDAASRRQALTYLQAGERRARELGQPALAARARRLRLSASDLSVVSVKSS